MTSTASPVPIRGLTDRTADVDGVRLHYRRGGDPTGALRPTRPPSPSRTVATSSLSNDRVSSSH